MGPLPRGSLALLLPPNLLLPCLLSLPQSARLLLLLPALRFPCTPLRLDCTLGAQLAREHSGQPMRTARAETSPLHLPVVEGG